MELSKIRELFKFCKENSINFRETLENIINDNQDFEVDDYRFINNRSIDSIMQDELESDAYVLGGFNDWFIADNSDLSYNIVEALQDAEKYEEIGQHLIDNNFVEQIQKNYAQLDGYGHHFGWYDGEEMEIDNYYVFRLN